MRLGNLVNRLDATFFVEVNITAGVHLNVITLSIFWTSKDDVVGFNLAT